MPTKLGDIINPQVMGDMINAKIEAQLKITPYAKVDTTLQGVPGDTKTVPSWNYVGDAEDFNPEDGNEMSTTKLTASSTTFTIKCAGKSISILQTAINSGLGDPIGQAETFTAATEKEFSDSKTYYEKYTGWNAAETVIGATKGGTKLTITPEFADIEPDGATVKVKGLSVKTGETAKLETNLLEVTEDVIRDVVVGLKNAKELTTSGESGTTYTEIVSTPDLSDENYVENLAFVGKRLDGRKVIVLFETALCTSGFDLDFKNKDSSTLKAVFECYADLTDDPTKLPYHVYVQN